jgi:cell wall-associated NlpC family hydrolase
VNNAPWILALDRVLRSWAGTPYVRGQGLKGVAVDCVGFVAGVLDELHGHRLPPPERGPVDVAWHDGDEAERISLKIAERWPHLLIRDWRQQGIDPGDVLLARVGGGKRRSVGHVLIVGADDRQAWHAPTGGLVSYTSTAAVLPSVAVVWRAAGREGWR